MEQFQKLVNDGAINVLCEQSCIDALNNNQYEDFQDFLDEAVFECWIEDYPQ